MGFGNYTPMPGMYGPGMYGPPGTARGTGQLQPPMGGGNLPQGAGGALPPQFMPGGAPVLRGAGPMAATNMGMIGNLGLPGGPAVPQMGPAGDAMINKLQMQGLRSRMGGIGPQLLQAGMRGGGGLMGALGGMAQMLPARGAGPIADAAAGAPARGGLLGSISSLFGRR